MFPIIKKSVQNKKGDIVEKHYCPFCGNYLSKSEIKSRQCRKCHEYLFCGKGTDKTDEID